MNRARGEEASKMAEPPFSYSTAMASGGVFRGAGRNVSPDSVICTPESNFSLLSPASASVDRSSFTSDAQDLDSVSSDCSQKIGEGIISGRESLTGGDQDLPDLIKVAVQYSANVHRFKKADKPEVHKYEDDKVPLNVDDEAPPLDSARNSFSLALKGCQERRSRSEALAKKSEHHRPASLDLNNSVVSAVMKKNAVSSRKSGNFPSPGTPSYRQGNEGTNKGWSSERVPLQTNANRRQLGTMLHSFNNGRNLPSKWEDAERWIFSPVAGDGNGRSSHLQQQKRPKSKSGPLGAPGFAYYAQFSPGISMYDESNVNSLLAAAGVLMPNAVPARGGGNNGNFLNKGDPCVARSASVHGCSNLICQTSEAGSQDEKVGDAKDATANAGVAVTKRDAATQMSPEGSCHSSSRSRSSFSASTPSIFPIREMLSFNSTKPDVRDVQVDERVTVTRWSKKHKSRISGKGSEDVGDWKLKAVDARSSTWEVPEASKSLSKVQREEAKITAWENLQKAKAEAAIRRLEMKLEKKRSRSIDKIMSKLRSAEKKAQEMRSSVLANQENQDSKTASKAIPIRRSTGQMGLLSGCFTCKAFPREHP